MNERRYDVVRTATTATFPVVLVFAADHIINAATSPGEGFSGGILVPLAVLLLYVGVGYREIERSLPLFGRWGLALGLAIGVGTGLFGLFTGRGFMGHADYVVEVMGEKVHLSTSIVFDLAIFVLVSSGTLAIFRAVGRSHGAVP